MNTAPRLSVVVLASGEGSNFQAIADAAAADSIPVTVRALISDRAGAPVLERARRAGIAAECIARRDYPSRAAHDAALAERMQAYGPDLVVLAGYMRVLDEATVSAFHGRMINVHPSLLPRHRGLHTHRRVLDAGETVHGASVHYVTPELDAGPPILQFRLAVRPWDSAERLETRVRAAEHRIYPMVIDLIARGRTRLQGMQVLLDGKPLAAPLVVTRDLLASDG